MFPILRSLPEETLHCAWELGFPANRCDMRMGGLPGRLRRDCRGYVKGQETGPEYMWRDGVRLGYSPPYEKEDLGVLLS